MYKVRFLLMLAFGFVSFAVTADETIEHKIADCYKIKDSSKRLACYDDSLTAETKKLQTQQDVIRQEWSGTGLTTTRPFHMDGPWEFQWDAKGQFFQVMMYRKGEAVGSSVPQFVASQNNSGGGSSYVASGGDYYLVVNAIGSWKAKAVKIFD